METPLESEMKSGTKWRLIEIVGNVMALGSIFCSRAYLTQTLT